MIAWLLQHVFAHGAMCHAVVIYAIQITLSEHNGTWPPQNAFASFQYTDSDDNVHTLESSAAEYTRNDDFSATWQWANEGMPIPAQTDGATTPVVVE